MDWFYKATPTKVSFEETRDLALEDGFICRSAFEVNGSRADNTQQVDLGDIIHMYFSEAGQPLQVIGSFEVVGQRRHPFPERFGKGVAGTQLYEVSEKFAQELLRLGDASAERYQPDPVLKKITGWFVIPRPDLPAPNAEGAPLHGRATLVRG